MNPDQSDDILRAWSESAFYWEKHRRPITRMLSPITRALIQESCISTGDIVLDIAGGAGEPSLTIAQMVGESGRVVCTDAVRPMLDAAEREASRRQLSNVRFQQCLAESLPFDSDTFNATVSRLGIMFFTDPDCALSEMLRVTKPGGRVSVAAWQSNDFNPFFRIVTDVMAHYIEPVEEAPDAPGAFRFDRPGLIGPFMQKAGATTVTERIVDFHMEAPVTLEEFWPLRVEMSDTLRAKVARLSEKQLISVAQEVRDSAKEFFPQGTMQFPARVIIVTGTVLSSNS